MRTIPASVCETDSDPSLEARDFGEEMKLRFATPEDAPAFARWATENPQIPAKDVLAGMKENNPTATVLVLEDEEKIARLFIPAYFALRLAYLGFNPENTPKQTAEALKQMLPAMKAFAEFWHINEIDTLTQTGLPMARWASKHGFEPEERELFTLKVKPTVSPEERAS